jgi:hypothetical protein
MVQPSESRQGLNLVFTRRADFCRPSCWRVLREPEMRAILVIVEQVGRHQPFEMPLIQDDHVVQQIAPATSHPTLSNSVLPRTTRGRARLCRAAHRRRRRCVCRARFSRTRSSRELKAMSIQPRRCRSDAIIARILPELAEFSYSPSRSFCRCTTFWRRTAVPLRRGGGGQAKPSLQNYLYLACPFLTLTAFELARRFAEIIPAQQVCK